MLDRTFAREIKKINGNGSREAKFEFLRTAKKAARELSTPNVMEKLDESIKKYGRATIGICLAVTIFDRRNRLESKTVQWAIDVLKFWENRPGDVSCLVINDGLHPTRIAEYAYSSLIKYTLE